MLPSPAFFVTSGFCSRPSRFTISRTISPKWTKTKVKRHVKSILNIGLFLKSHMYFSCVKWVVNFTEAHHDTFHNHTIYTTTKDATLHTFIREFSFSDTFCYRVLWNFLYFISKSSSASAVFNLFHLMACWQDPKIVKARHQLFKATSSSCCYRTPQTAASAPLQAAQAAPLLMLLCEDSGAYFSPVVWDLCLSPLDSLSALLLMEEGSHSPLDLLKSDLLPNSNSTPTNHLSQWFKVADLTWLVCLLRCICKSLEIQCLIVIYVACLFFASVMLFSLLLISHRLSLRGIANQMTVLLIWGFRVNCSCPGEWVIFIFFNIYS